ncbi:MAG TPA: PAS domain-containing protein [Polyangiaceae bacterium]|nr:PAS domain-containing protein [Polyangiaceae bacterium]
MTAKDPASLGVATLDPSARALQQSEEALRQSEERLRLAQQAARVGSFEWNIQTGVNVWTPELEALYGLAPGQFGRTQQSWEQLVHPADRAQALAAVERALESSEPVEAEWRVLLPDGSVRWLLGRFRMLRDGAGRPQRLLGVNLDISERKHNELALQELNGTLERLVSERTQQLGVAHRELEEFTYSVAHSLRAPLRGMNGFAKILLEEYSSGLGQEALDCLHRIQGNAVLMGQLIDGLLALARVARGSLEPEAVDLSSVARSAAAEQAAQAPERAVQLVVRDGLHARIDRTLARMLFHSLLGNAWKFTSNVENARVEVGCSELRGERVFFVRDNGVGFNMAYANKLFVPFQRLHGPREFPGVGIGLAACQQIIGRHGGRMWAEGREGEGAAFFFTLPPFPGER